MIGTNVKNLMGENGGNYLTTGTTTGNWGAIQALQDSVLTLQSTNIAGTLSAITVPAGGIIFGIFTSITVTSGAVIAYTADNPNFM